MTAKLSLAALLVIGIFSSFWAQDKKVQNEKGDTKMIVTSEHFSYSLKKGQAVYTTNVVVIDSQIDIFTDRMTVIFAKKNPAKKAPVPPAGLIAAQPRNEAAPALQPLGGMGGNVDRIICEGNVIIVNKKDKATATGDRAVYTAATELVVITGNARLRNERGILLGKVIEYNRRTGDLTSRQATEINEGKEPEEKKPAPKDPKGK